MEKLLIKAKKYVYIIAIIFWILTAVSYFVGTAGRGNLNLLFLQTFIFLPLAFAFTIASIFVAVLNLVFKLIKKESI